MTIAIIGMGNMGGALADALLAAAHDVVVWNRSPEKCAGAFAAGAVVASTAIEAVQMADLVIMCLSDSAAVSGVLEQRNMARALYGKTLVQLSQTTPAQSESYALWAEGRGIGYLDGSIMGMPSDVRDGRCMIVYSGSRAEFVRRHDVLADLGGLPRHLGTASALASTFDKAFFSALYAHFTGLIHGAAMCRAAGIALDTYFELMVGGWDWQSADADYAKMMLDRHYSAEQVTLDVHAYAFRQVPPLCRELGVDAALPLAIEEAMYEAIKRGHGKDEIAALIEVLVRGKNG